MTIAPKSLEEHQESVFGIAGLSLYFAWRWRQRHPEESLADILAERTLLRELCGFRDEEYLAGKKKGASDWGELAEALRSLGEACGGDPDVFERTGLERLRPVLEAYLPTGYARDLAPLDWDAGSLRYEKKPILEEHPGWCVFHISNALSPRSFLDDDSYLIGCFRQLLEKSEAECGYDTLYTFTWLNAYPKWLRFFPGEWQRNLEPPHEGVFGNLGFWGQIFNARKLLNPKAAAYVREHVALKFPPRKSHCSYAAMRAHLASLEKV